MKQTNEFPEKAKELESAEEITSDEELDKVVGGTSDDFRNPEFTKHFWCSNCGISRNMYGWKNQSGNQSGNMIEWYCSRCHTRQEPDMQKRRSVPQ